MASPGSAKLRAMSDANAIPGSAEGVVRFGLFEVDRKTGELRRNGARIRLQDQPFQILLTLLEKPGAVVTREELRSRLWRDDTFVDFEHSINTAVRRLRDALGDTAENPRYVETVARRGYRFLAPINGVQVPVVAQPALPIHPTRRWWVIGAVGFALLSGVVVGWHAATRRKVARTNLSPRERRLTANAPELPVTDGVISPDGRYLAFTDPSGFYLRQVDTGETHAISLPEGFKARPRCWRPDGTHLLVTAVEGRQEPESIWEISVIGGAPRKLVAQGAFPSVSPDGANVAYLTAATQFKEVSLNREIWVVASDGEQPRKLLEEGDGAFGPPAWSPDGTHIAYMRGRFVSGMPYIRRQLEILDVSNGTSTVLVQSAGLGENVAWAGDGRLIYSLAESVPNQNDANLWAVRVGRNGRADEPVRLTHGTGSVSLISLTTDSKRLAYFRQAVEPDVYITDIEDGGRRLTPPRRLTLDERADVPYSWTPDSKTVIFVSDRNGAYNIFRQGIHDPDAETLVRTREDVAVPRLSPDGSSVVYLIPPATGAADNAASRLMRASLDGGPPQEILEGPGIVNQQCARLPSKVCIFGQLEPGHEHFFYFDLNKGVGEQIAKAEIASINAYDFNWSLSPDGRTLAMARRQGIKQQPTIRILPLGDGPEKLIPVDGWAGIGTLDWAADSKSLWVTTYNSDWTKALVNVSLNGTIRPLLEEKSMMLGWAIPSPDGKHLAIWKAHGDSNVWMLENF